MIEVNYGELDRMTMLEYIQLQGGSCNVEELFHIGSIEKLRIYSLIYRLREDGLLEITDYSWLGSPQRIKLLK